MLFELSILAKDRLDTSAPTPASSRDEFGSNTCRDLCGDEVDTSVVSCVHEM